MEPFQEIENFQLIEGDIRIRHSCIIAEIKDIFHEAAQAGFRISIKKR